MKVNINRQSDKNKTIHNRILKIAQNNGLSDNIQYTLIKLFDYMMEKNLYGCCHSLSSALYVALCELEEKPKLCIGECFKSKESPFDHSWIELNGKVIDIAVYMPLTRKINSVTGVIIMDIDTLTQEKYTTQYGCYVSGLDYIAKTVMETPFSEYMDKCPFEVGGLWNLVKKILPPSIDFDASKAKQKYSSTQRMYIHK